MKPLILSIMLSVLTACATVHNGELAQRESGDAIDGLLVSATELSDPAKESFSMIAMTFENQTDKWIRVEKAELVIDEKAAKMISVVVGTDLLDWASAMQARSELEAHNQQMTQLGLAGLGAAVAVVGSAKQDSTAIAAGLGVMTATEAWMVSDAIVNSRSVAQNPKTLPGSHLYTPFAVPGKMFLRRWVLINKPVGKALTEFPIAVTTVDGKREIMTVKLNKKTL